MRLNPTPSEHRLYVIYMRSPDQHGPWMTARCRASSALIAPTAIRSTRDAFNDFSKLVRGYPNSQYATDAYKRMVFLKDRLAKYELSVVDYYTDRGAWVAVWLTVWKG